MITVSIVSHGHGVMLYKLIEQLQSFPNVSQIIITLNIPEPFQTNITDKLTIIHNDIPYGFGANHNKAIKLCLNSFFCVMNPDIEFVNNPFPVLLECISQHSLCLAAPLIISSSGEIEDSAREFPSFSKLLKKLFFSLDGRWPLDFDKSVNYPDWVAGMFMLFTSESFKQIGGFDDKYFLYYEDVDICRRIKIQGSKIGLCTNVKVIHDAQRASRKKLKFLIWHIKSSLRFFFQYSK
jgi:GT2 family glycosyltransferase